MLRSSTMQENRASIDDDDDDDPSTQLHSELTTSITAALSIQRPLLTHLNADTTWLLSLPYSPNAESANEKRYFHILIDPWLRGSQSDVAAFFSQQWHKIPSCVETIPEVEEIIDCIEAAARGNTQADYEEQEEELKSGKRGIDAVIISHEFTDHMHKETLLGVPTTVPVYATTKAAGLIRGWGHFNNVHAIPKFGAEGKWRIHDSLPPWLGITRVAYGGADLLYYHSAIMITFSSSTSPYPSSSSPPKIKKRGGNEVEVEAIIYTPHGVQLRDLEILKTNKHIKILALMHGLQDISLPAGAQLNLGAHNGLKVLRMLGAKYWIGTHDEVKTGGGLVSWFLRRRVIGLRDAIEKERNEGGLEEIGLEGVQDVRFEELGSGESIVLE